MTDIGNCNEAKNKMVSYHGNHNLLNLKLKKLTLWL